MTFPSGWELVLVLLVILVVFGAKRLPDSARALGRSMRILKAETKGLRDDDVKRDGETTVRAEQLPPAAGRSTAPQYGQQPPPAAPDQTYGDPQHGAPQHGAPQHGAPQHGASQPGAAPQAGAPYGEAPGGAAQPPRP